ncbi:hypothetical protein KP509_02G028900 [Ceratopteris richardii]|nr:hypothetical protein KP509_02G028900 [Ceratopteris richardii]
MQEGRWSDLLSLLLTSFDLVFANAQEKDLECVFAVICDLVSRARSPDEALAMADQITIKLSANPNDKPSVRLKILFCLYNIVGNPYGKFLIYKRALKLAINGKVTELMMPSFKRIDSFLKEWNISAAEKRELYFGMTNILKDVKGSTKESFTFLVKYLETFAEDDPHTLSEAKDEAVRAIIEFVKSPDMFQCDLLELPAIHQLQKDAKFASVFALLEIFLTRRLDAYLEFQASNSSVLTTYGISHEECVTKMRLMSLADLASQMQEIPYALVQETLKVPEEEVEYWIVRGISSKLIDAKMDQMRRVAIISRCTERVFGPAQWKDLYSKLAVWRNNVANVVRTVQNARAAGTEIPQALVGAMH